MDLCQDLWNRKHYLHHIFHHFYDGPVSHRVCPHLFTLLFFSFLLLVTHMPSLQALVPLRHSGFKCPAYMILGVAWFV